MAVSSDVFSDPQPDSDINLYSYGYGGPGSIQDLAVRAKQLSATVIDVRISPRSKNPTWRKNTLESKLGSRYIHCDACGNVNYKSGPIKLKNPARCVDFLTSFLDDDQAIILLCYCPNPVSCHRSTVIGKIDEHYQQVDRDFAGHVHLKPRSNPTQTSFL